MKINGRDIKELGFRLSKGYDDALTAPFNNRFIDIPGRPGGIRQKQKVNNRILNFQLVLSGEDRIEMKDKMDRLKQEFIDRRGQLRKATIQFDFDRYFLAGWLEKEPFITHETRHDWIVDIQMICDPYRYGAVRVETIRSPSISVTLEDNIYEALPNFLFRANLTSFEIKNIDTGEYFKAVDLPSGFANYEAYFEEGYLKRNGEVLNEKITFGSTFFGMQSRRNTIEHDIGANLTMIYVPKHL